MELHYHKVKLNFKLSCWRLILLFSFSCASPQVGQPPPQNINIKIFYKNNADTDLLNPDVPNSFKQKDLKVISKMEVNGAIKEVSYEENGIEIYLDGTARLYYFGLLVPTNYGKKPIATYVNLSPTVVDTVTYTFLSQQRPYIPDKIYYNRKLVWDVVNTPSNGLWPPITIIK